MSIHAFHSKLMSGKEEGTLFEALRRLKGIEKPALAEGTEPGWSYWTGRQATAPRPRAEPSGRKAPQRCRAPSRGPFSADGCVRGRRGSLFACPRTLSVRLAPAIRTGNVPHRGFVDHGKDNRLSR